MTSGSPLDRGARRCPRPDGDQGSRRGVARARRALARGAAGGAPLRRVDRRRRVRRRLAGDPARGGVARARRAFCSSRRSARPLRSSGSRLRSRTCASCEAARKSRQQTATRSPWRARSPSRPLRPSGACRSSSPGVRSCSTSGLRWTSDVCSRSPLESAADDVEQAGGLLVIPKVAPTPEGFPRRPGVAKKRPLA